MRDIPFNVSARTARLIGRENVSSAEGALIELMKNCYDADARNCIVYFDDEFVDFPGLLTEEGLLRLCKLLSEYDVGALYNRRVEDDLYSFLPEVYFDKYSEAERKTINEKLSSSVSIYIIDDGAGMEEEVIETNWMTIGTDNKNINSISESGRIRSGAKGIGRFALDRLGEKCDLYTKTIGSDGSLLWKVNWGDFDAQGLTIDRVSAKIGFSDISFSESVLSVLSEEICSEVFESGVKNGTRIGISQVRDYWSKSSIAKIYQELESLVPPADAGNFRVFLFSKRYAEDFGRVEPSVCDDFDYKLTASMDNDGLVSFIMIRNEMDPKKIRDGFLQRPFFKSEKYADDKLFGGEYRYSKTLYQLMPGLESSNSDAHKKIGCFNFVLYFLKKQGDTVDASVYMQRSVNPARKRWLDNNNGIRIYRDNFRVRPYGDIGKASWDWLGLGRRQSEDPSAPRTGKWRVTPRNISGAINISRVSNIGLEDKSSREGIQENDTFLLFCNVIENIIKEFELDRSAIFKEAYLDHKERQKAPSEEQFTQREEINAEELAQKIFEDLKKDHEGDGNDAEVESESNEAKLALALLKEKARAREIDDRLEEMKKENSLLRVFASSGITIASFTHELDSLNAKLGGRFDHLERLIHDYAELDFLTRNNLPEHKDPFVRIKMLRRDDERVKNWIKYSLRTIRKDKRKRVKINIKNYLENLRDEWSSTLAERQVELTVAVEGVDICIRAYEIDLDCIFNNLIINSADAFKRPGFSGYRGISILVGLTDGKLILSYQDTGPGLAGSIVDPVDIFKPTFTTKINSAGEETGTGLGMWLVEKTLEEYGGAAKIISTSGFSIVMEMQA
ncbi:sensor histidine kinase [Pseudomonas sp. PDM13]|uniref:sensor histidine kinase n=1 Tax=Pseudomonas sp. PDM13 TaxID=2769255 RepID=UPI0021E0203F|nr:sensor histidine kinase [Pseudomonas sp. PDM13]MCU9947094.1 ATP-binding protein [Pseudomonas sp. PDM13]